MEASVPATSAAPRANSTDFCRPTSDCHGGALTPPFFPLAAARSIVSSRVKPWINRRFVLIEHSAICDAAGRFLMKSIRYCFARYWSGRVVFSKSRTIIVDEPVSGPVERLLVKIFGPNCAEDL